MSLKTITLCDMCGEEIPEGDLFGGFRDAHVRKESGCLDLCEKCSGKVQAYIMGDSNATARISDRQLEASTTIRVLAVKNEITCGEAITVMEAAFGVDGIHDLLHKLCIVLEGGQL